MLFHSLAQASAILKYSLWLDPGFPSRLGHSGSYPYDYPSFLHAKLHYRLQGLVGGDV